MFALLLLQIMNNYVLLFSNFNPDKYHYFLKKLSEISNVKNT